MDVDHVYTWVNPNDEALMEQRRIYAAREGRDDNAYRTGPARVAYHGELKASLASARRFLPFVRKTYIVGAGSPPPWLAEFGDGVTFIDQDMILPARLLPAFQSDLVEAYIHRIPGLSERYLYSNDDYFFAQEHSPADFFLEDDRLAIGIASYFMGSRSRDATYGKMGENSIRALRKRLKLPGHMPIKAGRLRALHPRLRLRMAARGLSLVNATSHVTQPFFKSLWTGLHEIFAAELERLATHRFRSRQGILVNAMYHHYARAIGRAEFYLAPGHRLLDRRSSGEARERFREDLQREGSPVTRFCLNDAPVDGDDGWQSYIESLTTSLSRRAAR